jgi:hypothetical protein
MKALNDECGFLCYRTERPPKKVDKEREFNSFNDLQSTVQQNIKLHSNRISYKCGRNEILRSF